MNIGNSLENLTGPEILTGIGSPQQASSASTANAAAVASPQPPAQAATLAGDKAQLSEVGTQVAQAASQPDVRLDKVAAIQNALAAGTYHVPASAVAQKVISSLLVPEK